MIEPLSSRIHFAVFGQNLSFDDGLPDVTDGAFMQERVSGGKILAAFRIPIPLTGEWDELQEYTTRFSRYFADGTLDKTFGKNGHLDVGITSQVKFVAGSRIFVVFEAAYGERVLKSYTLNGRVDTTFGGGDGIVTMPTSRTEGNGILITEGKIVDTLSDGRILLRSEVSFVNIGVDIRKQQEITRLNADGSFDKAFGRNGFLSFRQDRGDVNPFITSNALYIHSDYLYSTDPASGEIIKLSLDGKTADLSFGGDGRVDVPGFVRDIKQQPDGKLLYLQAYYNDVPTLYRLNTDGSLDSTFSGDGKVALQNPGNLSETDLGFTLDDQGRVIVSAQGTIFRFSPSGALDSYPFNGTVPFTGGVKAIDDEGKVYTYDGRQYGMVLAQQLDRNGIVQITTDYNDDVIDITDAGGGKIRVVVNGESKLFRTRDIKGFNVQAFDGDLHFHTVYPLPVTLKGGTGDADIVLAGGNDDVDLGIGDHSIDLGGGNDKLELGEVPAYGQETDPNSGDRHTIVGSGGNKQVKVLNGSAAITFAAGDHDIGTFREAHDNSITIAGGNNTVYLSGTRNDTLTIGGNGRNDVTVFSANSSVTTGTGADKILAISPYGTISTTGGNDEITIRNFGKTPTRGVTVYAGSGNDHVFCDKGYNSLATVYGGPGDDLLEGGTLSQRFYGENGNDTLHGGDGNDYLYGGDLDDVLIGGANSDRLYGEAGNDKLYGQYGNDMLYGGVGDDRLFAQTGNDELFGDEGDDRLYADDAAGRFIFHGGAGNDLFFTRNNSIDTLYGDGGDDVADADANDVLDATSRSPS